MVTCEIIHWNYFKIISKLFYFICNHGINVCHSAQLLLTMSVMSLCSSRHFKWVQALTNMDHISQVWLTMASDRLTTESLFRDVQRQNQQPIRGGRSTWIFRQCLQSELNKQRRRLRYLMYLGLTGCASFNYMSILSA